jgi:branched-chain amino acid transport system ATP-binding protein
MLNVSNLQAAYGAAKVLFDISLSIGAGEVVTLLGRNGMGKTTTINTIMGLLPSTGGSVTFDDRPLTGLPPYRIAQAGIGLVPEGRQIFPTLTVEENLAAFADRHVIIEKGRVVWTGTSAELKDDPTVKDRFLHV